VGFNFTEELLSRVKKPGEGKEGRTTGPPFQLTKKKEKREVGTKTLKSPAWLRLDHREAGKEGGRRLRQRGKRPSKRGSLFEFTPLITGKGKKKKTPVSLREGGGGGCLDRGEKGEEGLEVPPP